jgi:cytochrome c oxidase assembly factor CtaG
MNPATDFIFAHWSPPWLLTAAIFIVAGIYIRGWLAIRKTRRQQFPDWRLAVYLLGLVSLWIALASPLDAFADALLSAHMVQHLLLMSAVPPLILLGAPVVPLLRGLPRAFVKTALGPLFSSQPLLALARFLTRPVVAWLAMNLTFLLWHTPAAYDYALWNQPWHRLEHLCFLITSLLFWWPVIQPWPAKRHPYRWGILIYLLSLQLLSRSPKSLPRESSRRPSGWRSPYVDDRFGRLPGPRNADNYSVVARTIGCPRPIEEYLRQTTLGQRGRNACRIF